MKNKRTLILAIISVLAVALVLSACSPKQKVAGKINDTVITQDRLDKIVTLLAAQNQINLTDPSTATLKQQLTDYAFDTIVMEEMMKANAINNGIEVTTDAENTYMNDLVTQYGGEEQFGSWLKSVNLTRDQFVELNRPYVYENLLYKRESAKYEATLTDEMMKAYYDSNKESFKVGEQVHARHILVATEQEAKDVIARIKGGEKFEDVAKAVSTDTSNKDQGGDLNWFGKGAMVKEFEDAAFSLPIGQLSDPVKTTYGYHIIQVLEKDPNRQLEEPALTDRKNAAISDWLDKARTGPEIKRDLTDDKKKWAYNQIKWSPPGP
jgi:foldase protein PrsA